jgi:hypothetical protein
LDDEILKDEGKETSKLVYEGGSNDKKSHKS